MIDEKPLEAAAKAIRRVIEMRNNSLCYSGDALLDERSWPTEAEFARAAISAYEAAKPAVAWITPADLDLLRSGGDHEISVWTTPMPKGVPLSAPASKDGG